VHDFLCAQAEKEYNMTIGALDNQFNTPGSTDNAVEDANDIDGKFFAQFTAARPLVSELPPSSRSPVFQQRSASTISEMSNGTDYESYQQYAQTLIMQAAEDPSTDAGAEDVLNLEQTNYSTADLAAQQADRAFATAADPEEKSQALSLLARVTAW
jgi:hypothetical protein